MKQAVILLLLVEILVGCSPQNDSYERAVMLRKNLLESDGCEFETLITADYGEKVHTFRMACTADSSGALTFRVLEPDTIEGITGKNSELGGQLTFDDSVLMFEPLADGQISPVSAPWILIHTLRSGYISACGNDGDKLRIQLDDSYREDALHVDIWTDENTIPVRGEILYAGRRILSVDVERFTFV